VGTLGELLAGSVGTASLAALSRALAVGDEAYARKTFQMTLEISLVLVSPVMVFCLLLGRNIIRLVFERGSFTAESTALLSMIFFYYSLSLLFSAAMRILVFYLFARQEAGTYIRLAFLFYGLALAFDLLYVGALRLGPKGIPLGYLTSLILSSGLAFRRNLGGLRTSLDRALGFFAAKDLLGSALAAVTVWAMRFWLEPPHAGLENFLYLCKLCGAGSLVFFGTLAASRALRVSQLSPLWRRSEEA
jgi:peptidoglycan biosynthesis protein MviN/MurJ (putative lipid II flippase)